MAMKARSFRRRQKPDAFAGWTDSAPRKYPASTPQVEAEHAGSAAAQPSAESAGYAAATTETTMGTEYYVACRDCKKVRGLDKFYAMTIPAHGRSDALALGTELQKEGWSFRCALLTSFLWQHKGHNCTVFSEHDEEFQSMVPLADEPEPGDYEEDSDKFWKA